MGHSAMTLAWPHEVEVGDLIQTGAKKDGIGWHEVTRIDMTPYTAYFTVVGGFVGGCTRSRGKQMRVRKQAV